LHPAIKDVTDHSETETLSADSACDTSGGGKGAKGTCVPGGIVYGVGHLEGRKYGILKFGRLWRIGVCIAFLHPPITP